LLSHGILGLCDIPAAHNHKDHLIGTDPLLIDVNATRVLMPDRLIRLLHSLKPHPSALDLLPAQSLAAPGDLADQAIADRANDLRHAFPLADDIAIDALTAICSLMSVPSGEALILEGEKPDAVYIVVTGLLAAYRPVENGQDVLLDRFAAGEVIGDIGFITGEARTVTVRALRNSELLRISKQDLQMAAARCPGVLMAICSGVVQRLERAQPASATPLKFRTFCLVPADHTIDIRPILQKIAGSLEAFGTVSVLSAEQTSGRPSAFFSEVERHSDFVLFQADCGSTPWTRFCLRQCDRIVLVAQGDTDPDDFSALGPGRIDLPHNTPLSLMLLWQDMIVQGRTTGWLKSVNPSGHHHIRCDRDIERASRLIAGRGLGLVLSGGGARALAHVGVIDALRTHDIQIDAVGGTSVGGIVAAVFALEWDLAATVRTLAAGFNRRRFSDFALPRTALYSERAFARTLGHCFGDIAVEDSPIPLCCVSTNLTEGSSAVHRRGRLTTWLRATSAVPGICPPIMEQNAVYVDGGVLNNMPTDAVRDFGVASAISVDVGSSLETLARSDGEYALPNMLDLLWRVGTIGSDAAANRIRRDGDVVLRPEVGNMGLFDWNAHERAIAAGHQAALDHLDEIKAALGRVA
jgi:NTE family protein